MLPDFGPMRCISPIHALFLHACAVFIAAVFCAALALVVAGCKPSRRAWQPMPEPAGVRSAAAYAVVAADTPLSIAPRRNAPAIVRAIARDAYGLPVSSVGFTALRILGEEDGWAHVETLGEPRGPHCADNLDGLEAFRLRLYVPSRALVPVTQREVNQRFDDGTQIELARGVPLEPLPDRGWFRVHAGGVSTVLRLAPEEVGTRYLPSPEPSPEPPVRWLPAGAIPLAILGQTGRLQAHDAHWVFGMQVRGSESLVLLRPQCARIRVRVPTHALLELSEQASSDAPQRAPGAGVTVRGGTPVRWRDGRAAGVVTRDVRLHEVEPSSRMRCFAVCEGCVELCVDRRALAGPGSGAASLLDPPSG